MFTTNSNYVQLGLALNLISDKVATSFVLVCDILSIMNSEAKETSVYVLLLKFAFKQNLFLTKFFFLEYGIC